MASLAQVFIEILPDASKFGPALQRDLGRVDAAPAGQRAGDGFVSGFGRGVKRLAGVAAAAFTGVQVGRYLADAVGRASDMNETVNKANVIFASNAASMQSWAANAAMSFGLTRGQALETAASFGNMFSQLGFGADQAASMSQQVVQLSTDLGSFNNLPTAQVADMVSAAFRGEYDSLQRLIPNITAARVAQEAMSATGKKNADTLTAQEKAAATLAIITRDGAAAQGDFARTQDGLANRTKQATALFGSLQSAIGQQLLPVVTAFAGALVTEVLPPLISLVDQYGPRVSAWLVGLAEMMPRVTDLARGLFDLLASGDVTSGFLSAANLEEDSRLIDFLLDAREAVLSLWESFQSGGATGASASLSQIGTNLADLMPLVREFASAMPGLSDTLRVTGVVTGFLADNVGALSKWMPALIAAFVAFKVAQAAANVAMLLALPTKVAELAVNRQLIASNRALVASRAAETVATAAGTVATGVDTAARQAGIMATIRATAVSMAQRAAQLAAAAAAVVWTGAQWALNAALTANPIGLVIAAVAALAAGVVIAYKNSETFRRVVAAAWSGIQSAAAAAWQLLQGVWSWLGGALAAGARWFTDLSQRVRDAWAGIRDAFGRGVLYIWDKWSWAVGTVLRGAADMLGWVPGIGGRLREASAEFDRFRDRVNGALAGVQSRSVSVEVALGPGARRIATFQRLPVADGGIIDYYAAGGLRERHVAQIARAGAMRVWAEPETGGEAYIPFAASKRARSLDIWRAVGDRLGVRFAEYANGGINLSAQMADVAGLAGGVRRLDHSVADFTDRLARQISADLVARSEQTGAAGSGVAGRGNVDSELLRRFDAWNESLGNVLRVVSGYRSRARQQVLYDRYLAGLGPVAARPGSSKHEMSPAQAIDYGPASWARTATARRFGLLAPVRGEAWHLQLADTGGLLRSGQAAVNASGRAERVLSPAQTDAFERLVTTLEKRGGTLVGGDLIVQSTGDPREDLGEVMFQLRRIARGGVHAR